jgi:hypothetical protein
MLIVRPRVLISLVTAASIIKAPSFAYSMTSTVGTSSQPQFGQTNKFDPQQTQQRNLNVDHYLDPYYQPKGSTLKLKDHTEFYASGSPGCKKGVIIIPDTLGWNTGRVRNICDFFGDNDCYAVIPELSKHTTHAGGIFSFYHFNFSILIL